MAWNVGKRLVKSPKVYIQDTGIVHALLNLKSFEDLLGHPVVGASWEGFVIENIISTLPMGVTSWFYRTAAGAEIDLVLEDGKNKYAIDIKRSMAPSVSKGFYMGADDIMANKRYIVYLGDGSFPTTNGTVVVSLIEILKIINEMS